MADGVQIDSNIEITTSTSTGVASSVVNTTVAESSQIISTLVTGAKGDKGDTGSQGPQGNTGPQGEQGEQGIQGIQGIQGDTGDTGPTGSTGPAGADGATWSSGSGAPSGGNNGDFYLRTSNSDVYKKTAGTWSVVANIQGATGATGATGAAGATGATGAAGVDGKTVLNGAGVPGSGLGVNGDFYIDTAANDIYGPKAGGSWPAGVSLVGPTGATGATGDDGNTVLNGTVAPDDVTDGVDGDFYIDTVADEIYGPKTAGAWGSPTSIVGPAGAGSGDVNGPASSVDGEGALFSGTTGKLIKRSTITGMVKATSGVHAAATEGTDYWKPGGTDVAVADGGTGASTAAGARTNLGLGTIAVEPEANYALLAGRAGGQTLKGDTASGGNLTLQSTAHATKGKILLGSTSYYFDEANSRLTLGATTNTDTRVRIVDATTDTYGVYVNRTGSDMGANTVGLQVEMLTGATSNNASSIFGLLFANRSASDAFTRGNYFGLQGFAYHQGSVLMAQAMGAKFGGRLQSSGGITDVIGMQIASGIASGATGSVATNADIDVVAYFNSGSSNTVTSSYIQRLAPTSATTTSTLGIAMGKATTGATRNVQLQLGSTSATAAAAGNWSIYDSTTYQSALSGNLRVGATTAPTVALDVTGEIRATTAGTNAASVVLVGGTQTLTNKTLTSPVINTGTVGANPTTALGIASKQYVDGQWLVTQVFS